MAPFLVAYGTGEGQTAKVAERVADTVRSRGHEATVVDVADASDVAPVEYDAVLVGSSIHVGTHQPEVRTFVEETGWQPDRIALFGGALRYSKYGFLKRLLMKRIAKDATGDTDAKRDYEYTDWAEVEAFANDVAAFVEGRLGEVPADVTDQTGG